MPTRIPVSELSSRVLLVVDELATHYKLVVVAIDVNDNTVNGGYVALVHNRAVHDPFERSTHDMPFYIDRADQRRVLDAYRVVQSSTCAPATLALAAK